MEERRSRLARRVLATVGGAAAIIIAFFAIVGWLSPSVRRRDVQIAPVARGNIDGSVQANGIVVPEVEQVVSSPIEARVLRVGRRPGDRVKAGDELLTLDTAPVRLELSRLDQRLAQKGNEATQLQLRIDETVAALRAQLEQRRLDGEIVRLKSDQTRTLRSEGLVSEGESLVAATAAKKTAIEIAQLEGEIVRARRTGDAQLAAAAIDLGMLRAEREESRRQLDLAMLRADRDGVITSIVQDEGTTIRRGEVLARIANLSSFRVTATISDLYVPRIATGMRTRVKLDETNAVGGTLTSIDPRIENGIARLNVTLDPDAHTRLRNNIRVDVDIITGNRSGVLRVRRGALGHSPAEDVFVVRRDRLMRRRIRYGFIGSEFVEIAEGLLEGDQVVTSDMSDYAGVKELRLK